MAGAPYLPHACPLEGLRLFPGCGHGVDEMLRAGRFREVMELGLPCPATQHRKE